MILLLLTTLQFTAPERSALSGSCEEGQISVPINDLRWGHILGSPAGGNTLELLRFPLAGMEGQTITLQIELSGPWNLWVRTEDWAGNLSCLSNTLPVNGSSLPVAAPIPQLLEETWYDILGRRIPKPTRSGVYFVQRGPRLPKKVVHLR